MLNYQRTSLLKRTHLFGDVVIGSTLVVGIVLESAFKLAYSAVQGALPKPLEQQGAADHQSVRVEKVIEHGSRPRTAMLKVPAADAEKAILIARKVVDVLKAVLHLTVLAADHFNAELPARVPKWIYSHDIIGQAAGSGLLDSVEIKIREVACRTSFNWQKTLEEEAEPCWAAELDHDPSRWRRRVLVFVELRKTSHDVRGIHVSNLCKGRRSWQTVCGWEGFPSRDDDVEMPSPAPDSSPVSMLRAAAVRTSPTPRQLKKLQSLLAAEGVEVDDADGWVPLAAFLRAVGQASAVRQAKRLVVNTRGKRWTRTDGGSPRVNREYKYNSGTWGGGQGAGSLHGKLGWLRFVYGKYYCQ